ncbi:unnamed protein product [Schistocephalus solidus]|uniref:Uncharacterized protein n=1 Tax=Schistocephalus solidus TaxID=70667 RepID=A0A183T578_SCHSO|nr:unnamed protein product [Schistocephalus solidus]
MPQSVPGYGSPRSSDSSSVHGRCSCRCSSGKANSEDKTTSPWMSTLPSSTDHGGTTPRKESRPRQKSDRNGCPFQDLLDDDFSLTSDPASFPTATNFPHPLPIMRD